MSRLLHLCDTPSSDVIWRRPLRVAGVYKREKDSEFGSVSSEFSQLVVSQQLVGGPRRPTRCPVGSAFYTTWRRGPRSARNLRTPAGDW